MIWKDRLIYLNRRIHTIILPRSVRPGFLFADSGGPAGFVRFGFVRYPELVALKKYHLCAIEKLVVKNVPLEGTLVP